MPDTTQQLKADIDTGKTGDKIDQGFDPGLAPLGTDDEASGVRSTPEQIQQARKLERSGEVRPPAEQGQRNPTRGLPAVALIVAALLVLIVAVAVALWVR